MPFLLCKGEDRLNPPNMGMIPPCVFELCGIDKEEYTGFAFGVGLERVALLKYEIDDMRLLYENDIRFIKAVLNRPIHASGPWQLN